MNVLNLGAQTISSGEFSQNPDGGLILRDFAQKNLLFDPSEKATRGKHVHDAIDHLSKTHHLSSQTKIDCCLSSNEIILRFAQLPGATVDDVRAIIDLEAQQILALPLEQITWDYQILNSPSKGIWNVVFAAIKTGHLSEISQMLAASHFDIGIIDTAPIALYNAFRFNYVTPAECVLLVDIGASTTDLLFIEGRSVFFRNISIGGRNITEALAKELETSFEEAEALKTTPGLLPEDVNDPIHSVLSALAHQTFGRIYSEITHAVEAFRTEHKGSAPKRIYLCGGTAGLLDIIPYFSEKLGLPVELFNPLRNVALSSDEIAKAVTGKEHTLGELIGTALRTLGNCPLELDFNQSRVQKKSATARQKPYRALIAACSALIFIITSLFYQQATSVINETLAPLDEQVKSIEKIAQQMDEALELEQQLAASAGPIMLAIKQRNLWPQIVNELSTSLPPYFLWITVLTPLSNGEPISFSTEQPILPYPSHPLPNNTSDTPSKQSKTIISPLTTTAIEIDGLYLENPEGPIVVDNFVTSLSQSPLFSFNGKINEIIKQRTTPDGSHWAYPYRLILNLSKRTPQNENP